MIGHSCQAIRLTLRPHLLKMRAPSGLPPTGALLSGEVVRVDPALGLLLKVCRGRIPDAERSIFFKLTVFEAICHISEWYTLYATTNVGSMYARHVQLREYIFLN